jgi:C-terminal processing protease CtpA/Prc
MNNNKTNRIRYISFALILIILALLSSCSLFFGGDEPEPEPEDLTANEYVYEAFKEWYFWYDQLPEIDPNEYDGINDVVKAIRVDVDRWSYAASYTETMDFFERGEFKGFGGGFKIDADGKIKITHVYSNSPFGKFGVKRGWIVESVNGFTVDELSEVNKALNSTEMVDFVFTDFNQQQHSLSIAKESFAMNTVLHYSIIEHEPHTIAYIVFDSFVDASEEELQDAFKHFEENNVSDLIVDLRYNGGGVLDIALMLTGMIGGEKIAGKLITTTTHSDKKKEHDSSSISEYDGVALDIDKVYFITTRGTASASEMVINSLYPYMDVVLVGSDTHGKPAGMYILSVKEIDLAIMPVSFINTNSLGFGEYFSGLPVDIAEADDFSHDWGHPDEAMLKAAVNDITGQLPLAVSSIKSAKINKQKEFDYTGINQFINAY